MVVVDLADLGVFDLMSAAMAASHAVGRHGVIALDPVADVEVVDVLLDDVVAAEPDEVIPVAHLVFHFGLARLALAHPDGAAVPVGPHEESASPSEPSWIRLTLPRNSLLWRRCRPTATFNLSRRPACWFPSASGSRGRRRSRASP